MKLTPLLPLLLLPSLALAQYQTSDFPISYAPRQYAKTHKWENADKIENYDKIVDVFHPELIEANKQYATDLLTHVNKYTNNRLADEPAVCMVEINNEDTIFFWGGVQKLANLPQPYSNILQKQWNDWLLAQYKSREKL